MFAAASGARLARRHNKATIKKQSNAGNSIDGLQLNYRGYQKHGNYSDPPGVHNQRRPQRCNHNYTTKLYSSDSESVLKLSSSYLDLHHGRIPNFGHVDFEGKAAWQDRELGHYVDRRESTYAGSEAATTHRFKQKEAHKRWVKRNRIHDSTFGECSSEEEDGYGSYGAQHAAANALLYIGLGTMCIGMIIAFVGTGEKGFKTIELRLIGPSLIGAGFMIIILRVMLCVCPSKCLKFNKHKHKNSTSKLNSEEDRDGSDAAPRRDVIQIVKTGDAADKTGNKPDLKKRVSIVEMPTTSSSASREDETQQTPFQSRLVPVEEGTAGGECAEGEGEGEGEELSIGSEASLPSHHTRISWGEGGNQSDLSVNSIANGFLQSDSFDSELSSRTVKNASKFESERNPRNVQSEIVLTPSNLNEFRDGEQQQQQQQQQDSR